MLNGELDNNKARVLLAILNGRVQAYKVTQLEDEMDNLSALLEEYNENNR